jgi:hypothetical protein
MAVAITKKSSEYILDQDKELDKLEQTIFNIKPLSAKQYAKIQDTMKLSRADNGETNIENIGSYTYDVLVYGLEGWSNFKDETGNQVKFNSKSIESSIDYLGVEMRYELANAIMQLSVLGGDKEKN